MKKFLSGFKKFIYIIDKLTDQGVGGYDFAYDAAQKLLFILSMWILFSVPWGDKRFGIFIFCCVGGRIIVMPMLQLFLDKFFGGVCKGPFLWIPRKIWKFVVLIAMIYLLLEQLAVGELIAIPSALIMFFVGFFVFAGYTTLGVAKGSDDPNKIGSPAWKEANGVQQVGFNLMNPLWRDKYGNYYKGTQYVPIVPPVDVVNKKK